MFWRQLFVPVSVCVLSFWMCVWFWTTGLLALFQEPNYNIIYKVDFPYAHTPEYLFLISSALASPAGQQGFN